MIGIGITTRNRPEVLELAIEHFVAWPPPDHKIVVIDDASSPEKAGANAAICFDPRLNIRYFYSPKRLGIAGAKNACLWELRGAEHTFLFDDDAMPGEPSWWLPWTRSGIDHLTFSMDLKSANQESFLTKTNDFGETWEGYTGCLGCCLYLSRHARAILGGYDPRFGIYGFEHCQLTHRAFLAGLSPVNFCAPKGVMDSIYTLDMHLGWLGISPPLRPNFDKSLFDTSVTPDEAQEHKRYAHLMDEPPIYCKLEDWQ